MTILLIGVALLAAGLLGIWGVIHFRRLFLLYLFVLVPLVMLGINEYYIRTYRPASWEEVPISLKAIKDIIWIFVLLCFVLWRLAGRHRASFPRELGLPIALFVGYEVLQAVRGYFSIGLMGELLAIYKNLLYVPAAYIAVHFIRAPSDLRVLARRYAYLMLAVAAYGFAQMILQIPSTWSMLGGGIGARGLYYSFFLNFDQMGWFSCTVFGLTLLQKQAFAGTSWLYWLTICVSLFWTFACQSRAAVVALGAVVVFLIFRQRIRGITAASLLGTFGLLGLGAMHFMVPESLQSYRLFGGNILSDPRITEAWPYLWRFFADHPVVGSGLGLFGFETFLEWYPASRELFAGVDNTYFLVALTGGVIGLGLFLFLLLRLFQVSSRTGRAPGNPLVKQAAAGVQLALVVSLVYFFSSDFLDGFPESLHIWFLFGVVGGIANVARKMRLTSLRVVEDLP
jgi:O-antigen ligase/polysaccharide polymerase Wzy-like membrane protein